MIGVACAEVAPNFAAKHPDEIRLSLCKRERIKVRVSFSTGLQKQNEPPLTSVLSPPTGRGGKAQPLAKLRSKIRVYSSGRRRIRG